MGLFTEAFFLETFILKNVYIYLKNYDDKELIFSVKLFLLFIYELPKRPDSKTRKNRNSRY